jgi:hypothetical protein
MTALVDLVERSLAPDTGETFEARVDEQAAFLRDAIEDGSLDNDDYALGMELEVYAVDGEGRLTEVPPAVFDACGKELGRHNAELNTDPDRFSADGIAAQAAALESQWERAQAAARDADCDLVLDAMWTVPPSEGSVAYLSATEDVDGLTIPSNMRPAPRYVAIDRDVVAKAGGSVALDVPGAQRPFPSILFESLATSIQPHVQVPTAAAFPDHYNTAIRTLGPVLALTTNSPFLPADLYDESVDPATLLETTHHELRIAAFEQSVNHTSEPKVRVPRDIDTATDVVDRLLADPLLAPFLAEWLDEAEPTDEGAEASFTDRFWEYEHKRGTYWRWLRCVIGGDPVVDGDDERSLRIEYRPIPTQPTVKDAIGVQCLVAGLVRGLVAADHPLSALEWSAAESCFYEAVEHGLEADLAWVTSEGERTAETDVIFDEVFAYARRGLAEAGVDSQTIDRYLGPLETRWETGVTPSRWKIDRVREALAETDDLAAAMATMQREYRRRSREYDTFAAWL